MAKFHLNPATGEASRCKALFSCPFGSTEEHYPTIDEAREAFEQSQDAFSPKLSKPLSRALSAPLGNVKIPKWMKHSVTQNSENRVIDSFKLGDETFYVADTKHYESEHSTEAAAGKVRRQVLIISDKTRKAVAQVVTSHFDAAKARDLEDQKWGVFSWAATPGVDAQITQKVGDTARMISVYEEGLENDEFPAYKDPYGDGETIETAQNALKNAKRELWAELHRSLGKTPEGKEYRKFKNDSLMMLSKSDAPNDEERIERDIASFKSELTDRFNKHKAHYSNATVEKSWNSESHAKAKLADIAHVYSARIHGESGRALEVTKIMSRPEETPDFLKAVGSAAKTFKKPRYPGASRDTVSVHTLDFRE